MSSSDAPTTSAAPRRSVTATIVVVLIVAVYGTAFLTMAWVRSQQGHGGHVPPSEIESLAIHPPPTDPLTDARQRGEAVYRHYCNVCHGLKDEQTGAEGKGDGPNSGLLAVPPRNFTDASFWNERTTDERVHDAIAQGGAYVGKSVLMPAWGNTLSENQIRDVIVFIRSLPGSRKAPSE